MATATKACGLALRTSLLSRNMPEAKKPTATTSPIRAPARASTPRTATSTTTVSRPASTDGSRAPRSMAPKGAPACGSLLGGAVGHR